MEEYRGENRISLRGMVADYPILSHQNHQISYYTLPLRVPRLSGTDDLLNLIMAAPDPGLWLPGRWVDLQGEVRSYNNRSGVGSRLVVTVLVRSAAPAAEENGVNHLVLAGAICRNPTLRRTPLGREICDLLLAVNRPYGRADYLPCIAWGSLADHCADLPVGSRLHLEGRLQSRQYRKIIDGAPVTRTAFEVSIMNLLPEEDGLY